VRGVRPFPAHPSHVLCYLGYLQEEDDVKACSLQPYLSAINSWHADMGLSKPAVGQAVNMLRRGYCEVQGDEDDESVLDRRPIPAYVMRAILTLTHSTPSQSIRRAATASVLCYAFMLRADSCVVSNIDTSPLHRRAWHYSFMSRPAGATSLPRYIDLDTTRSTSSSAIGCACAAPLAKLRYGRFQTDSTTLSHRSASTGGFKRPVTSWASVPPKVSVGSYE
jgi:hypothetical protein